jgi:hypothetical protein
VTTRERFGVAMIVVSFGLTPFAYGASVAFGVLAVVIGLTGLVMFATARPWRSRGQGRDDHIEPPKVLRGPAVHDLERSLVTGARHAGGVGMGDGDFAHTGEAGGDGGGGDGGGSH